jgi:hypothetical protein
VYAVGVWLRVLRLETMSTSLSNRLASAERLAPIGIFFRAWVNQRPRMVSTLNCWDRAFVEHLPIPDLPKKSQASAAHLSSPKRSHLDGHERSSEWVRARKLWCCAEALLGI